MLEKIYYFEKQENGNVFLLDNRTNTLIKSLAANSSIEQIDNNRLKINSNIGNDGLIIDYRKIDGGIPEIDQTNIHSVIASLGSNFFFLDNETNTSLGVGNNGSNKILKFSYRSISFYEPNGILNNLSWLSNNLSTHQNNTDFNTSVFSKLSPRSSIDITNFPELGYFGVYHNCIKEGSYIKRIIIDVDTNSSIREYTNLELIIHKHTLSDMVNFQMPTLRVPFAQQKVVRLNFGELKASSKHRKIYDYEPPAVIDTGGGYSPYLRPNSRICVLLHSNNTRNKMTVERLNIEIEIEKTPIPQRQ